MPVWAFGSEPRPVPSLAAPEPSPESPLPGPGPWPMPVPPPDPPAPGLEPPAGDMAMTPGDAFPGTPTADPGWFETTTPFPSPLLLPEVGGASTVPASIGPPTPPPLLPVPRPPREPVAPERLGGG